MKKILILLLLLGFSSSVLADTSVDNGSWFIQINGDTGFPTGNLYNAVNQGWGGEGSIGYRTDNLALSVESGYDTYSAKNGTFNGMWNLVPLVGKIQFGGVGYQPIMPYIFVAAGLAFNSESASAFGFTGTTNETDFLGEGGLGLSFGLTHEASFFMQGKVELDNTSKNYSSDSPTVLIPVNAGFNFALE
jgi:hypothetical protein